LPSVKESLTRKDMWLQMLIYPGHTLPTAAAPVIVAVGLAFHQETVQLLPAMAAFLSGWFIQLGGVLTDNYESLRRNPNDREHPELVQALNQDLLTLEGLRRTIGLCYFIALLSGAYLFYVAGPPVLIIGLLSIWASWAYSAGSFPLGARGLADPLFFLFFGTVSVVATYYVQAAATYGTSNLWASLDLMFPISAFLFSVPVGALTTNILIIDDIRDREFDLEKGKHTIAVRFGKNWSRTEFTTLLGVAYVMTFVCWRVLDLGVSVLLPLVTVPMAISINRKVFILDSFSDLVPMTPRAARLLLAYSILVAIGVARA
jgi:1,4-dihydroxy-2-naphthoate octaprenyltransferase